MFDVAERRGFIKQLKMMHLFSQAESRFPQHSLGRARRFLGADPHRHGRRLFPRHLSCSISTSRAAPRCRSRSTSPLISRNVRNTLAKTELGDKNLLVVERGMTNTEYTIDTSEQSVDNVKKVISDSFGDKLKKYTFEYTDIKPIKEGDFTGIEAKLLINADPSYKDESGVAHDALRDQIARQLVKNGHTGIQPILTNPEYHRGSNARFNDWTVRIAGLDEPAARTVLDPLQTTMRKLRSSRSPAKSAAASRATCRSRPWRPF